MQPYRRRLPCHRGSFVMYMQHEDSAVGGKSRPNSLEGESDWGTGAAREPEATIKLKAARGRKCMVVMRGVSAVGNVVDY